MTDRPQPTTCNCRQPGLGGDCDGSCTHPPPDQHADTPDEAALVERVARAIVRTPAPGGAAGLECRWVLWQGEARAAIAAMQPEMAAAHEAGRREGWEAGREAAAQIHDAHAADCERHATRTPDGVWSNGPALGADAHNRYASRIRTLIPPAPGAATEAGE